MRTIPAIFLFLCVCSLPVSAERDSLVAVFWNLENFFDTEDGGTGGTDREFTPSGERYWTSGRYWRKCNGVAKAMFWMCGRYGRMPDVVGVAEVENRRVMQSVARGTLLRKYDYVQVHADSPDERGIDVALLYRESVFRMLRWRAIAVDRDMCGGAMKTRDILYVCLERDGERFHFLVNHHPSKYGGEKRSAPGRLAAMGRMVHICDSLLKCGERNIVCMGDFNDTPDGTAFSMAGGVLVNLAVPLAEKGLGTIRYDGKWELIDMFLVDAGLSGRARMDICFPGFLSVPDNAHSGLKPLRTYTGPRYSGGISDHLPVVLVF